MANEVDQAETPPGPEQELRATLDRHGHGFHYAVRKQIATAIGGMWGVEAVEFPVACPGPSETHLDLVLRHFEYRTWIVGECKRADPALIDWCFVRIPDLPQADVVALERILVVDGGKVFRHAEVNHKSGWAVGNAYHLPFPIKRSSPQKGDSTGNSRTALDQAVAQVLRGTSGFVEYLAARPTLLYERPSSGPARVYDGMVVPVVFTTAKLWTSDVDLAESDLATGKVQATKLTPAPWLWLKTIVSPSFKHGLTPFEPKPIESVGQALIDDYTRSVAIVTAGGIQEFLHAHRWR